MQAGAVARIEKGVDCTASALLAAACGYAAWIWFSATAAPPVAAAETLAVAVLAFVLVLRALSAIRPVPRRLPVPVFDVREVEPMGEPELLLTDRVEHAPAGDPDDALLLDDILARLDPDSRVVRLFDPASMPTAGELKSRIDRHLDSEAAAAQTLDAAQSLHDALAELRRSMR